MHDTFLPCPCCGSMVIDEPGAYEICQICQWEDDPIQSGNPHYAGGANNDSLLDARAAWVRQNLNKMID